MANRMSGVCYNNINYITKEDNEIKNIQERDNILSRYVLRLFFMYMYLNM
jgi:hypothetical protein